MSVRECCWGGWGIAALKGVLAAAAAALLPSLPSLLTLERMEEHLGMWRSAAVELKERPQLGQGTKLGSGAEGALGGGRGPPPATAALYSLAALMASLSWLDLDSQALPAAAAAAATGAAAAAGAERELPLRAAPLLLRSAAAATFLASAGTA